MWTDEQKALATAVFRGAASVFREGGSAYAVMVNDVKAEEHRSEKAAEAAADIHRLAAMWTFVTDYAARQALEPSPPPVVEPPPPPPPAEAGDPVSQVLFAIDQDLDLTDEEMAVLRKVMGAQGSVIQRLFAPPPPCPEPPPAEPSVPGPLDPLAQSQ